MDGPGLDSSLVGFVLLGLAVLEPHHATIADRTQQRKQRGVPRGQHTEGVGQSCGFLINGGFKFANRRERRGFQHRVVPQLRRKVENRDLVGGEVQISGRVFVGIDHVPLHFTVRIGDGANGHTHRPQFFLVSFEHPLERRHGGIGVVTGHLRLDARARERCAGG